MGFRLRKTVKFGKGINLNFSKSGLGISAGTKGARIGIGPKGIRKTAFIPGTGLAYITHSKLGNKKATSKTTNPQEVLMTQEKIFELQPVKRSIWGLTTLVGLITFFIYPLLGFVLCTFSGYMIYNNYSKSETKSINVYNKAIRKYEKGKIDESIVELHNAINFNNDNVKAHEVLGIIYYKDKSDFKNSLEHLKFWLKSDPSNIYANFIIANCYFHLGLYNDAIQTLQIIPSDTAVEEDKSLLLGKSFHFNGQHELAIEQLKKTAAKRKINEDVLSAKYLLGISLFNMGDKIRAKRQLLKVYSENMMYENIKFYAEELRF